MAANLSLLRRGVMPRCRDWVDGCAPSSRRPTLRKPVRLGTLDSRESKRLHTQRSEQASKNICKQRQARRREPARCCFFTLGDLQQRFSHNGLAHRGIPDGCSRRCYEGKRNRRQSSQFGCTPSHLPDHAPAGLACQRTPSASANSRSGEHPPKLSECRVTPGRIPARLAVMKALRAAEIAHRDASAARMPRASVFEL